MDYSSVNEYNQIQSLFSLTCDSGRFFPYIHPNEVTAVKNDCADNRRINTITCKDKNIDEFLYEIGSLDMNTIRLNGVYITPDKQIPVIPKVFFPMLSKIISQKIVAVTLEDIFVHKPLLYRDGHYRISYKMEINIHLLMHPVFQKNKVILLFSGRDILIEYLWWNRENIGLFDKLAKMGFFAVTTPNFSIFAGECPFGHALNTIKGLYCAKKLEEREVSVIPHLYSINDYQLSRQVVWLKKNPGVKTIAMNCQIQRKSYVGRDIAIRALQYLLKNTEVNIILHGSDYRILQALRPYETRLYTASSGIFKNMEIKKMLPEIQKTYLLYSESIQNFVRVNA